MADPFRGKARTAAIKTAGKAERAGESGMIPPVKRIGMLIYCIPTGIAIGD
jgi:hypothetical protein